MTKYVTKYGLANKRLKFNRPAIKSLREYEERQRVHNYMAVVVLCVLTVLISVAFLKYQANRPLLDPRGTPNLDVGTNKPGAKLKIQEVKAAEKDWSTDLVGYFRHRGQEIGYNDYDITKLHEVMDAENVLHTADRVNYLYDGENGRYTAAGFAMITNRTWRQHRCEGSKWNGIDNINCFYKIIGDNQGLRDYYESRDKWGKLFDESSIQFIKL